MRSSLGVFCGVALWLSWALPGPAAAKPPSPAAVKEARTHYQQGETAFKLGRFPEALEAYSKAYEVAPLPGFLFNIGQCHRMLGNLERAVFFYRGYLRERPEAKNRAAVEKLIVSSEKKLQAAAEEARRQEAERARLEQEKLDLARERLAAEERARAEEAAAELRRQAEEAARRAAEAEAAARALEAEPPVQETWWFWTLIAGAVVVAAGGVALGLTLGGDSSVLPGGSLGTLDRR
jgi:tetratricopeptide (TPR) repeat protein